MNTPLMRNAGVPRTPIDCIRQRLLRNLSGIFAGVQTFAESAGIQPNFAGQFGQPVNGQRTAPAELVNKYLIVIGPELPLLSGAFAGLRGTARLRPQNGKMLVGKAHLAAVHILLTDPRQRLGGETPAVRSFEVAEFNHRDRRIGAALKVAGVGQNKVHNSWGRLSVGNLRRGGGLLGLLCRLAAGLGHSLAGGCRYHHLHRRPALRPAKTIPNGRAQKQRRHKG